MQIYVGFIKTSNVAGKFVLSFLLNRINPHLKRFTIIKIIFSPYDYFEMKQILSLRNAILYFHYEQLF